MKGQIKYSIFVYIYVYIFFVFISALYKKITIYDILMCFFVYSP